MLDTVDRNIKLLGVIWLLLAAMALSRGFYVVAERGDDWVDIAIFRLLFGAVHVLIVILVARQYRVAPRLLFVCSILFLLMYFLGVTSGRPHAYMDIAPLGAMVVCLWLTYSPRGRAELKSYLARGSDESPE
jgi:peptidoglycan/LPS O-acetylase OafA/YrhL